MLHAVFPPAFPPRVAAGCRRAWRRVAQWRARRHRAAEGRHLDQPADRGAESRREGGEGAGRRKSSSSPTGIRRTRRSRKDIDVNYFQHIPFLENANKQGGYNFVSIAPGTIMKIGLYSKKVKSFSELKDGAKVAIANDPVNGGRGLLLLQRAGHHAEAGRGLPRDDARHRREPEAPEDHPARSVAARALPRRRRSRAGLPELHQARRHDRPEQRAAVRRHREQDLRDPVGRAAGQRERSAHPQVHLDLPALAGGAQGARQRVRLAVRDRVVTEAA